MGLSLPKSNLIFLKKCLDKWVHFRCYSCMDQFLDSWCSYQFRYCSVNNSGLIFFYLVNLVINIFLNKKGLVFTTITRNVYSGKLL